MSNTKNADNSVVVNSLSHDGRGIAAINGKKIFLANALPGEKIRFEYVRRHNNYDEGRATEILSASADRVTPRCPHFGVCGGCSLQHLSNEAQIALKQNILLEQLQHFGSLVPQEILPPIFGPFWGYRGKARLSVKYVNKKNKLLIGFHETNGRFVADLSQCYILHKAVGEKITDLSKLIASLTNYQAIPQVEIACGANAIALIFRHLQPFAPTDLQQLLDFGERHGFQIYLQPQGIASIHCISPQPQKLSYQLPTQNILIENRFSELAPIDPSSLDFPLGGEEQATGVYKYIHDCCEQRSQQPDKIAGANFEQLCFTKLARRAANKTFAVKPKCVGYIELIFQPQDFTQVNQQVNVQMVTRVLELLAPEPHETILDLFCGLGNFTLPLARRCAKVIGVEGDAEMVMRATANAAHNNITNAEFYKADLNKTIENESWAQQTFHKIFLDPPRAGALEIVNYLAKFNARKIVYVSCNPATLARDAKILVEHGYNLIKTGLIDMFPHTAHAEAVAEFQKR